jgi:hypothetical protein
MNDIPTPQDVDTTLASLSDDDLLALVDAAGQLPVVEWWRLTAQQRRAMRAQNMLARRMATAEKRAADAATRAANKVERDLLTRMQQRAEQQRQENEPFLEKKRQELRYRNGF